MHIDWKCQNCGEMHLTSLDNLSIDTSLTLTCNSCNKIYIYKILSVQYKADCEVCNLSNNIISKETISLW